MPCELQTNLKGQVYHSLLLLHVRPKNEPTITDLALCHKMGSLRFRELILETVATIQPGDKNIRGYFLTLIVLFQVMAMLQAQTFRMITLCPVTPVLNMAAVRSFKTLALTYLNPEYQNQELHSCVQLTSKTSFLLLLQK